MATRFKTGNAIINQVASEMGLDKVADVFASTEKHFIQLIDLANACGEELLETEAWNPIIREHSITTADTDDGKYSLPSDFAYMIDQTGWERSENVPLFGPLSPQEWQYLLGRDLTSNTIYASFRLTERQLWIYPYAEGSITVPNGLDIRFEYVSRNWVLDGGVADTYTDELTEVADIVLYEFRIFERLLKARFLEARGMDNTVAIAQYEKSLEAWAGKDKSAPILNPSRGGWIYPYLDIHHNTPDTGFGGS